MPLLVTTMGAANRRWRTLSYGDLLWRYACGGSPYPASGQGAAHRDPVCFSNSDFTQAKGVIYPRWAIRMV